LYPETPVVRSQGSYGKGGMRPRIVCPGPIKVKDVEGIANGR
jgi:hypothetical protein